MLLNFEFNGVKYADYTYEDAKSAGVPVSHLDAVVGELKWSGIREERDALISGSDWTQMPDSPLTEEKKQDFANYRQALRDIPQTYPDPDAVIWPEKPAT